MTFITLDKDGTKHRCEAEKKGDWVIYTCPQCPDYERRHNLITDQMIKKQHPANEALHEGFYVNPLYSIGNLN